jgi:hypothetical protein
LKICMVHLVSKGPRHPFRGRLVHFVLPDFGFSILQPFVHCHDPR